MGNPAPDLNLPRPGGGGDERLPKTGPKMAPRTGQPSGTTKRPKAMEGSSNADRVMSDTQARASRNGERVLNDVTARATSREEVVRDAYDQLSQARFGDSLPTKAAQTKLRTEAENIVDSVFRQNGSWDQTASIVDANPHMFGGTEGATPGEVLPSPEAAVRNIAKGRPSGLDIGAPENLISEGIDATASGKAKIGARPLANFMRQVTRPGVNASSRSINEGLTHFVGSGGENPHWGAAGKETASAEVRDQTKRIIDHVRTLTGDSTDPKVLADAVNKVAGKVNGFAPIDAATIAPHFGTELGGDIGGRITRTAVNPELTYGAATGRRTAKTGVEEAVNGEASALNPLSKESEAKMEARLQRIEAQISKSKVSKLPDPEGLVSKPGAGLPDPEGLVKPASKALPSDLGSRLALDTPLETGTPTPDEILSGLPPTTDPVGLSAVRATPLNPPSAINPPSPVDPIVAAPPTPGATIPKPTTPLADALAGEPAIPAADAAGGIGQAATIAPGITPPVAPGAPAGTTLGEELTPVIGKQGGFSRFMFGKGAPTGLGGVEAAPLAEGETAAATGLLGRLGLGGAGGAAGGLSMGAGLAGGIGGSLIGGQLHGLGDKLTAQSGEGARGFWGRFLQGAGSTAPFAGGAMAIPGVGLGVAALLAGGGGLLNALLGSHHTERNDLSKYVALTPGLDHDTRRAAMAQYDMYLSQGVAPKDAMAQVSQQVDQTAQLARQQSQAPSFQTTPEQEIWLQQMYLNDLNHQQDQWSAQHNATEQAIREAGKNLGPAQLNAQLLPFQQESQGMADMFATLHQAAPWQGMSKQIDDSVAQQNAIRAGMQQANVQSALQNMGYGGQQAQTPSIGDTLVSQQSGGGNAANSMFGTIKSGLGLGG